MAGKSKSDKKHVTSKVWQNYEVKGDSLSRKNVVCPKCGSGVFMAEHSNRRTCGRCHYTEFKGKQ
ncbi:30S ribosomal protein S27ae [Candidatus Woesearchaeota archaeon]|nr:MAG: 30S ribosomal protein S27ae [Candidatus Woesearchaeota archaeon]